MLQKKGFSMRLMAIGLVSAVVLSGCGMNAEALEADVQVDLGTAVEVQQLKRTTIRNELTYIGQIEPQVTISVVSRLSAEVLQVNFDVGDTVQEGDILFTVDAKDIQDQIATLQASAAQTQVAVELAQYGLEVAQEGSVQERLSELQYESNVSAARFATRNAEQGRETARDAVYSAEAASDVAYSAYLLAVEQLAEIRELEPDASGIYEYNGTPYSQTQYEQLLSSQERSVASALNNYSIADSSIANAENARDSARIGANQANTSFDLALESYEVYQELAEESRERSIRQAEFSVANAQAAQNATQVQLGVIQSNLSNASIKSPISGVVSARSIEKGQMISAAALPFTIIQMDTVNVQVNVSEVLINNIQPGDQAQVVIQAIREEPFIGTVTAVSPAAGANSTYPVRVQLDNADSLIKPGMFSQVSFVQAQKDNTFVVDKNVVLKDETTEFLYVVENGVARKVTVTTGLSNGTTVEILTGVSAGDDIVVVGQEYLQDGTNVNIVKRDGAGVQQSAVPSAETATSEEEQQEETVDEDEQQEDDGEPAETAD